MNLRTGRLGIFPSAYAVDSDLSDWDSSNEHGHRERYQLGYVGSVETLAHKGTSVVCQAVRKVVGNGQEPRPISCILEISDQGLRMVDRSKRNVRTRFYNTYAVYLCRLSQGCTDICMYYYIIENVGKGVGLHYENCFMKVLVANIHVLRTIFCIKFNTEQKRIKR